MAAPYSTAVSSAKSLPAFALTDHADAAVPDEGTTVWSRERIEQLLLRHSFGYQRIALPHGLATPGDDRGGTAARIFPADMTGKTVVDFGCNHGYFCFEAIRRGASRVVGYDMNASIVRRARLLAECMGADIRFEVLDLDRELPRERFDYVLCLNVLHHLNDPFAVLDGLSEITAERLILELASPGLREVMMRRMPLLHALSLAGAPVVYINTKGKRLVSVAAAHALLARGAGFARIDTVRSGFKHRQLVIASKDAAQ